VNTLCFYGYSDDAVLAGNSRRNLSEYYQSYFLLSNGATVEAKYGNEGWQFKCSDPDSVIIPAVAFVSHDSGIEHSDPRIPVWLKPCGYSPVLLIGSEKDVTVVYSCDDPITETGPDFIFVARLTSALQIELDECEITTDSVVAALAAAGWEGGAK
jgi:hypothetical protein